MLTKTRIKMSNQSIIKYNPSVKKGDLVKVKLKRINPKGEKLCAVFDIRGIQLLLYVIEDFQIAVDDDFPKETTRFSYCYGYGYLGTY